MTSDGTFVTTITPQNIGGIATSYDFFFDGSSQTFRAVATLTNTNATTTSAEVAYGGDLGSDDGTQIEASESGDTTWDIMADGWVITSDGTVDFDDPVLTFVRFDPDSIEVASDTPAIPGIGIGFTEGVLGDVFTLELEAGQTERLMFFTQLSPDVQIALLGTPAFDSLDTLEAAGLLAGLSESEIETIVNWQPVPEPATTLALGGLAGLMLRRRR